MQESGAVDLALLSLYETVAEDATRLDSLSVLERARQLREGSSNPAEVHNELLETALRDLCLELIPELDIGTPNFQQIWNLVDNTNALADEGLVSSTAAFTLIEDLCDSQTSQGCKVVFDYLEARRESMLKKNLVTKKNVCLRFCNDLLRRLSRAEDAAFCGRVFIFMFLGFPLHDKSSVNLRGDFHTENTTIYDNDTKDGLEEAEDGMDVDQNGDVKDLKLNQLYPLFWEMQNVFSSPTRMFEAGFMQQLKDGLRQTLACFTQITTSAPSRAAQDHDQRGIKRKLDNLSGERKEFDPSAFNPKYLTNRDLFDLEVHDIDFRRHVLVQALILLDFLLGMTAAHKAKLEASSKGANKNKLLWIYEQYTISDEDRTWALDTKKAIERYLEADGGTEGRYYMRMINTVLSRDRNWISWKENNCQSIERKPIPETELSGSQASLRKIVADATGPLPAPAGASDLKFLSGSKTDQQSTMWQPERPTLQDYYKGIQGDVLDLDFADEEEKKEIEERKAGKLWRALRSAHGKRFALCEEIKNGENLDALVGGPVKAAEDTPADVVVADEDEAKEKMEDMADVTLESTDVPSQVEVAEAGAVT